MGCGQSSQPSEEHTFKDAPGKDVDSTDKVEPFTPTSPSTQDPVKEGKKEKEKLSDGPLPQPSAYVPAEDIADGPSSQSASSVAVAKPIISNTAEEFNSSSGPARSVSLSPGYKLENDAKKIGKFDPEAFRKANLKGGAQPMSSSTNQNHGDSWAQPVNSGAGGGGGGGFQDNNMYSNSSGQDRWQANPDYIQSDDIFSSTSPQAMQGTSTMNFRDDPVNDPFRSVGGLGHVPADSTRSNVITLQDDALMNDILDELGDV